MAWSLYAYIFLNIIASVGFRINFVLFFFLVTLVGGVVFILFAVSALFFGGEETWYLRKR